ncbi:MAG: isopentenyl phosphate kinase [Archaeoglobaceae archaeon]
MKVLKLGGSAVTNKAGFEEARLELISELCDAIAENYEKLVLVHGAGSFGHPHVRKFGLSNPKSVAKIHEACLRLNAIVCRELVARDVPAVPIHPIEGFSVEKVEEFLKKGFVPVLHGDVVIDGGFGVLSGDDIAVEVARELKAELLGFATSVEGVIIDGRVARVVRREDLDKIGAASSDVTGGMRAKVEKAMGAGCRVYIFKASAENLRRFLAGEAVGTEVRE